MAATPVSIAAGRLPVRRATRTMAKQLTMMYTYFLSSDQNPGKREGAAAFLEVPRALPSSERVPPLILRRRYGDISGLGRALFDPGAHRRERSEVETAFARYVSVSVESDVGDGVASPDKELALREVPLHNAESHVTLVAFLLQSLSALGSHLQSEVGPGAGHGDVWLVTVLFPVHPFRNAQRASRVPFEPTTNATPIRL